jgi:23S rRNA pseudouridine1911/1915/1917 synthase
LLEAGTALVDGARRTKSHRLEGGEQLEFEPPAPPPPLVAQPVDLRIPYEDDHLLVVDKPAGMVVHPGAGKEQGTLVHALLDRGIAGGDADRPGIVHRLDRDTSGLLVLARSDEAWERLSRLVHDRRLERRYVALVHGRPRSRRGRIEAPIGRDRRDPIRRSLDTDEPREAITHFEVARLLDGEALLDVRLETGRTHQIRVHMAALRHPCVGDLLYGADPALAARLGLTRQWLHAVSLTFAHPADGREVTFTSEYPADLAHALDILRAES